MADDTGKKLGKSQRSKNTKEVVSIAAFKDGRLLMGLRRDTSLYNIPGGHLEPGEDPRDGAARELLEETGLKPTGSLERIGFCDVNDSLRVHTFICQVVGEPDSSEDPDEEMSEFKWIDPKSPSDEVMSNLHNKHDITLQFLGVQEQDLDLIWDEFGAGDHEGRRKIQKLTKSHSNNKCMDCSRPPTFECKWAEGMARAWFCDKHWKSWSDEHNGDICFVRSLRDGKVGDKYGDAPGEALQKSLKDRFKALATAGAIVSAPAAANPGHDAATAYNQPHAAEWKPHGLTKELYPIAHLESSFGKRLEHLPHSTGEYNTAYGAVGLKASTGHEVYLKNKALQKLFPNLHDQDRFIRSMKTDHVAYNTVATFHWNHLKKVTGNDPAKTAFAWRWGAGKMARTPPELIAADPYVQAFQKLREKLEPAPVVATKFEIEVGEWLAKVTVQRTGNGLNVVPEAQPASNAGLNLFDVFDVKPPNVINDKHSQHLIYDLAVDQFNLFQPKVRQLSSGTVFEPVDIEQIKEQLKLLGYHGYRGRSEDPNTFVFFDVPEPDSTGVHRG